jgi:hypothetical protein
MIGVGTFELVVGLLAAALLIYLASRGRARLLTVVLLLPVLGIFIAMVVAYVRYALFGG